MRNLYKALLAISILAFACCDNKSGESNHPEPGVYGFGVSNVQMLTADVQAQVVLPDQIAADFELGFEVSEDMTFPEGTTTRCKVKYYNPDGTYSHSLTGLRDSTTYHVRAYMINQMCFYSSSPITVTTLKFRCVDLGLSVKWATVNVGAARPEEYGDYFAWGETEPKMEYSWATYKYCNGSDDSMNESTQDHVGSIGHYWTSSFYTESPRREYDLSFSPSDVSRLRSYRCDGLSIRPVCP